VEKRHLADVLQRTNWDLEKASRLLQISLSQVKRKITEHGLQKPEQVEASEFKPLTTNFKEGEK
jgi:DNA-binding NtrC family response regulator